MPKKQKTPLKQAVEDVVDVKCVLSDPKSILAVRELVTTAANVLTQLPPANQVSPEVSRIIQFICNKEKAHGDKFSSIDEKIETLKNTSDQKKFMSDIKQQVTDLAQRSDYQADLDEL